MTTIALHSDLHLQLQKTPTGWLQQVPDILILAGDIARIDKVKTFLIELAYAHHDMQILYVVGNHEFYHIDDMLKAEAELRAALTDYPRIHFLQCNTVELSGIRFLGCTGWSRMLTLGKEKQQSVQWTVERSINDFLQIGMGDRRFTTSDCIQLGQQHYDWLASELAKPCDKKTVVITHFAPSLKVTNQNYPIDEISAYFCSDFDALIEQYQPALWVFGHTHCNLDIQMGVTRVVSNQKGYGYECENSYQPQWTTDVFKLST